MGGGIPFIRPLRESLAGERIDRIMGIVNGTTNYILTRMSEGGAGYAEALGGAQGLGYAESDPTADVEGHDAAAKAAIIASIAFGARVTAGEVYNQGISGVTPTDISYARQLGFVIKLLAIAERHPAGAPTPPRRDQRAGASGDGASRAPAGQRERQLQRHLRGGRVRRGADVLRARGRRCADGQRRAR